MESKSIKDLLEEDIKLHFDEFIKYEKSIEVQLKRLMDLKLVYNIEFSVDLYYNDLADEKSCFVAKIHSCLNDIPTKHFRCKNFLTCIKQCRNYVIKENE